MSFGETLQTILHRRGLSQSRAAAMADLNHSAVSRMVSGSRHPERESIEKLVAGIGCTAREELTLYAAAGYVAPGGLVVRARSALFAAASVLNDESIPADLRDALERQIADATACRKAAAS